MTETPRPPEPTPVPGPQPGRDLEIVVDPQGTVEGTRPVLLPPRAQDFAALGRAELAALLDSYEALRIPIRSLHQVDQERYQRLRDDGRVRRIVRQFDWAALGVPIVSRRADGGYWLIDGQHRVPAVREKLGEDYALLCIVVPGLTPADEARAFGRMNAWRRSPTTLEEWKADLAAGDPRVLTIKAVLDPFAITVGRQRGGRRGPVAGRHLAAIGSVGRIYDRSQADGVRHVLETLLEAWPDDPAAFKGQVLEGLHLFLLRSEPQPVYDRSTLLARLSQTTVDRLLLLATNLRQGAINTRPAVCCGRAILAIYNLKPTRLHSNALPEWDTLEPPRRHGAARPSEEAPGDR